MKHRIDVPLDQAFHRKWRTAFERFAELHDDDASIAGWTASGLQARVRLFRRARGVATAQGRWLDIGCGAGTYTRLLHDEGAQVIGIDYSLPTLEKARARCPAGIPWIAADVTRLPLPDASCDGALCFGVMQAIPSSPDALASIARVLKPGGVLWIDALNADCLPNRYETWRRRRRGKPVHLRYETTAALTAALARCGFDAIAREWVPILPARLAALQPLVECTVVRNTLRRFDVAGRSLSHSMLIRARRT